MLGVAVVSSVFEFCCCACLWGSVVALGAVECLAEGRCVSVVLLFALHAGVDVMGELVGSCVR